MELFASGEALSFDGDIHEDALEVREVRIEFDHRITWAAAYYFRRRQTNAVIVKMNLLKCYGPLENENDRPNWNHI